MHYLYPLSGDKKVRGANGELLAPRLAPCRTAARTLVGRLPGSEGGGVYETNGLTRGQVAGKRPSPSPSLGDPLVCQGHVAPVGGDWAVPYPVDLHGRHQPQPSIKANARAGALSMPENL